MSHLYVVEEISPGDWRITCGVPSPGKISKESFPNQQEALIALQTNNFSFD
ncbi:hypothetical protein [Ectobacillus polymachus]|uniref:hypothetical protein n=1 Tax=Ectobacillus polymachus TaxID=1508806 RepID=UPI003A8385D5